MINIPPLKSSTGIKTELLPEVGKVWKVGQILNATAQQGGKAHSEVLLKMGPYILQAKTPVALESGQNVKLLVKSPGNPELKQLPLLSIQTSLPDLSDNQTLKLSQLTSQIASHKLAQFIAIQQNLSDLQVSGQKLLTLLNQSPKLLNNILPDSLVGKLQTLQNTQQVSIQHLDTSQLKQKILDSGIFLENRLHQQLQSNPKAGIQQSGLVNDLKYQLLSIKAELATHTTINQAANNNQTLSTQSFTQLLATLPTIKLPQQLQQLVSTLSQSLNPSHLGQLINVISQSLSGNSLAGKTVAEDLKLLSQQILLSIQQSTQPQQLLQQLLQRLQLQQSLQELSQQLEQSLGKITSLQLQPLSREPDNLVLLLFNLVFKDAHEHFDIQFRIKQEDASNDEDQQSWTATLSFTFKRLGKVKTDIHLINNKVSTVFYAEKPTTASKIKTLLPELESAFNKAGLDVTSLDVTSLTNADENIVPPSYHILDENI